MELDSLSGGWGGGGGTISVMCFYLATLIIDSAVSGAEHF